MQSMKNSLRISAGILLLALILFCAAPALAQAVRMPEERIAMPEQAGEPKPGDTWAEPYTGMEFVWVPGGCYWMGSPVLSELDTPRDPWWLLAAKAVVAIVPVGCGPTTMKHRSSTGIIEEFFQWESPRHEVCLDGFWMGKYEVTQAQWEKVMGSNPSKIKGSNNPVENVSWNDAQNYIRTLNSRSSASDFRLPTEAEWEYACRSGGKEELYCGGNNVDSVAWHSRNVGRRTQPVGGRAPNGLGIFDMSGNVAEWVEDVWDENAYSRHARDNPVITGGGTNRVHRGGAWGNGPRLVRSAVRFGYTQNGRDNLLGFRLAFTATKP